MQRAEVRNVIGISSPRQRKYHAQRNQCKHKIKKISHDVRLRDDKTCTRAVRTLAHLRLGVLFVVIQRVPVATAVFTIGDHSPPLPFADSMLGT